jgi:hypothetical protein
VGSKRSTAMRAACVAGVAGAVLAAGPGSAFADTPGASMSVSPSTNLVDGQGVNVDFNTGVLYDLNPDGPFSVPLYECTQTTYSSDPAICDTIGSLSIFGGIYGPGVVYEYYGSDEPNAPTGLPEVQVKQSWEWFKGTWPRIQHGTVTCTRQCYLVAQGPGLGTAPSSASKQLIFGAPK